MTRPYLLLVRSSSSSIGGLVMPSGAGATPDTGAWTPRLGRRGGGGRGGRGAGAARRPGGGCRRRPRALVPLGGCGGSEGPRAAGHSEAPVLADDGTASKDTNS